jgi:hypothetical protein
VAAGFHERAGHGSGQGAAVAAPARLTGGAEGSPKQKVRAVAPAGAVEAVAPAGALLTRHTPLDLRGSNGPNCGSEGPCCLS